MTGLDLLAKTGSRGLFIGGQWRDSGTGSRFQVHDPADMIVDVATATPTTRWRRLDAAVRPSPLGSDAARDRGEIHAGVRGDRRPGRRLAD